MYKIFIANSQMNIEITCLRILTWKRNLIFKLICFSPHESTFSSMFSMLSIFYNNFLLNIFLLKLYVFSAGGCSCHKFLKFWIRKKLFCYAKTTLHSWLFCLYSMNSVARVVVNLKIITNHKFYQLYFTEKDFWIYLTKLSLKKHHFQL